jgi:UDP-glucuronate decarboxylase
MERGAKEMRVLVTGGAGFVGSHLCDLLLACGHEVIALDNYYTGSRDNLQGLLGHPRFELLLGDVEQAFELKVNKIYNLACPASPVHYQRNPVKTVRTNILGAINVLDLANKTGARVLQASTSEVYGDPQEHPQKESYWGHVNPVGVRACYDEGKRAAETLFYDYHRQHGVDIRVARIFNTYGPRMALDDGRVVSNFIVSALQNKPLTVYGDGKQTRSFCYVADLVSGLMALMESDYKQPVNLGNPLEFSMLQLAQMIIKMTGSKSKIVFKDLPSDDPKQRQPDIGIAKSLGWEPKVDVHIGLQTTIHYFKRLLCAQ